MALVRHVGWLARVETGTTSRAVSIGARKETVSTGTIISLLAAGLSFTAAATQNKLAGQFTAASLLFSAQSVTARLAVSLSTGSLTISAQSIVLALKVTLAAASLTFVARAISLATMIRLAAASLFLTGLGITVNIPGAARARWLSIRGAVKGLISGVPQAGEEEE